MNISQILKNSYYLIRRNLSVLVLFWATNAAMAFILSVAIYSLLMDNLQHSLLSDQLALRFDYMWFNQFMNIYDSTLSRLPLITYSVVVIYWIIQTFYFGGMVAVFKNPDKNHISDFFYGGVRYWLRFMKILLISIVFFGLAFKLNDLLGDLFTNLFGKNDYYLTDFILRSLRYILLLIFIGIITIISDYAKISLAVDEKQKALAAVKNSFVFIRQNFQVSVGTFLIISVLGAVGAVIYNIIDTFVPRAPFYYLMLTFILQQMLIIFRFIIRMFFCASEVIIYNDINADYVKPLVKESTVGVK
ncbi:MAG: hypothetical protein JW995_04260 [Melioribacteraceae bacterium]|nr:hypothetical protein [Melioribacteraceae bacterium]